MTGPWSWRTQEGADAEQHGDVQAKEQDYLQTELQEDAHAEVHVWWRSC